MFPSNDWPLNFKRLIIHLLFVEIHLLDRRINPYFDEAILGGETNKQTNKQRRKNRIELKWDAKSIEQSS